MRVPLISLDEMANRMLQATEGTIAIVDAADATSSGASGETPITAGARWKPHSATFRTGFQN
jgi:hypothetical protein